MQTNFSVVHLIIFKLKSEYKSRLFLNGLKKRCILGLSFLKIGIRPEFIYRTNTFFKRDERGFKSVFVI